MITFSSHTLIHFIQKLVRELEGRAEDAEHNIQEKENTLNALQRHGEEAKR
jgi:prefoldin subunit 5